MAIDEQKIKKEALTELARKGGLARKKSANYSEMGRKGMQSRWKDKKKEKDENPQCKYCDIQMALTEFHKKYHIQIVQEKYANS